jgi:hypothetical protein
LTIGFPINWNSWQNSNQRERQRPKDSNRSLHFSFFIMTREMMLGMLRAGSNGEQILQILDTITNDDSAADIQGSYVDAAQDAQPTLTELAF